jgi:hypothetical protein
MLPEVEPVQPVELPDDQHDLGRHGVELRPGNALVGDESAGRPPFKLVIFSVSGVILTDPGRSLSSPSLHPSWEGDF